ncbi:hypothetical protein FRC11_006490 [Ceratobasidium sp. 423]|nr:hypothetical protein FRC11_006490 [Ceratobasidium sp. 423]
MASDISTSSCTISEDSSVYSLNKLAPYFLADLKDCECCDVDQLLAVFLDRSHIKDPNPSTPQIPQSAGKSKHSTPSTAMETPSRNSLDPTSPDPDPQEAPHFPIVSREFFHTCLKEITKLCKDSGLQERIREYQQAPEKKARYQPFVNIANYALKLLKSLKLSGLSEPSDLDILFLVNGDKWIKGTGETQRIPDIVVVPLASAKRSRQAPKDDWDRCAERYHLSDKRKAFEWTDVLISTEMKWELATLDFKPPETYSTDLKNQIEPLSTRDEVTDIALPISTDSVSNSNGSSSTSISTASTQSGSTRASMPPTGSGNSEAGARGHPKWPSDHPDQDNSEEPAAKKTKVTDNHAIKAHRKTALVQSAINGAEMLRCSLGRRHAVGLVIIDAVMWLWWFDRQGAIQSTGIHFIEDLPRFLVFLLAIQRFTLADWGFDVKLDPLLTLRHSSQKLAPAQIELDVQKNLKISFRTDTKMLSREAFCLKGRFTNVFGVTSDTEDQPQVAKLYWPNRDRVHEAKIINRARKVAPDLPNHLPRVFGSRDIDPIGTGRIREELGISSNSPGPPRVLRMIVFEELLPITERTGKDLVVAWLECHVVLWNSGFRHQDISLGNLMLRLIGSDYFGVINDWDLSVDLNESDPSADITGTISSVALDLLRLQITQPSMVADRLYYHDLESLVWTLIWTFLAVRDKEVNLANDAAEWQTSILKTSRGKRLEFLHVPHEYSPQPEWESLWEMAMEIVKWVNLHFANPDRDETPEKNRKLLQSLLKVIGETFEGIMPSRPAITNL